MIFNQKNIGILILILSIWLIYLLTIQKQGWIREYGGTPNTFCQGFDVIQAPNGDYIACGAKLIPSHSIILRVDPQGDTVWIKEFFNVEAMRSLELLSDGNIAVVAFNAGKTALIKLDANGNLIYKNELSWSSSALEHKILSTSDRGFLVASSQVDSSNYSHFTFSKTDPNGDTLWNKTYDNTALYSIASDVAKTADGGFVGVGSIKQIGAAAQKIYVIKTDASGNPHWQKAISVDSNRWVGNGIQPTLDGGYIVTGFRKITVNKVGYHIAIALKLDKDGNQEWLTDILAPSTFVGALAFEGKSILQNTDSSFIVTGSMEYFYNDVHQEAKIPLVKLDKKGTVLWRKYFVHTNSLNGINADAKAYEIKSTIDNGYIIVGSGYIKSHNPQLILIKVDSLGN